MWPCKVYLYMYGFLFRLMDLKLRLPGWKAIWHVCFQISSVSRSFRMDSQSLLYVITRLTLQCIFLFSWNDSVYITILQKTNFKQNIIWNIRIGIYCVNQLVIISYESTKIVMIFTIVLVGNFFTQYLVVILHEFSERIQFNNKCNTYVLKSWPTGMNPL